jgi:hypothetical protein
VHCGTYPYLILAPKEPIRNLSGKPRLMTSALRAAMPTHGDNGDNVLGGPSMATIRVLRSSSSSRRSRSTLRLRSCSRSSSTWTWTTTARSDSMSCARCVAALRRAKTTCRGQPAAGRAQQTAERLLASLDATDISRQHAPPSLANRGGGRAIP